MAEKTKKTSTKTTDRSHARKRSTGEVIVGSEVGVTLPIGDSTAHLRFSFWHERISPSDSEEDIKATAALVDDFNEAEIERRVKKYRRLVKREMKK
jgi:hypothetical protein